MRLLFITSNRIGDAVLSTGVLGRLLERHPGARVTIACGPAAAPLFAAVPGLDRVIPLAKRRRGLHWLELWRQTVGSIWDLAVDLRHSALSYLIPAKRRLVFRPSKQPVHRVVQLGALLGPGEPPPPRLWMSAEADTQAAALVPPGAPVFAVGPTANWGGKQWPAERFVAAAKRLTGQGGILPGGRIAVFGGPNERAAAAPLLDRLPRVIDLVGTCGLPVAAACLTRCAFYLGNDSGLMHLAAAAGVPTLGLFGPSRQELYAPWGAHTGWVRTPESFDGLVGAEDYDHRSQETRMGSLEVDTVISAVEALWQRCRVAA